MSEWLVALIEMQRGAAERRALARSVERATKPARVARSPRPIVVELHVDVPSAERTRKCFKAWAILKSGGPSKVYVERQ